MIPVRLEPSRELPGRKRREPTWQDEVRQRVRDRRRQRLGDDLPLFSEPAGPVLDVQLDEPSAPPSDAAPAASRVALADREVVAAAMEHDAVPPPPRLVWSLSEARREGAPEEAAASPAAERWTLGEDATAAPPAVSPAPELALERPRRTSNWILDAPEIPAEAEEAAPLERPAPWADRLQAAAFDLGVLATLWAVVVYFASRAAQVSLEALRPAWPPLAAYLIFLGFLYAVYFTGTCGRTVGKIVCGLRVVDVAGRPPGYGRAFVRALIGTVGILAGMLALVPIFFDPARRALHDRVLRTRVVKY